MRLSRTHLVPVAVVALSLVSAESAAAKCPSRIQMPGVGPNGAVVVVDGSAVVSGSEELDGMDPSNIHSIELTCWNPATGEFGGGGGVPIIRIHSKGLVESTRAPIEALLRAQEAYISQHSRYARSLDDLVEFGLPRDSMLEFSATLTGWSATTPRQDVDYRCFVYSGDAPQELAGIKEHAIVCQSEAAKANRALREMYEGSG